MGKTPKAIQLAPAVLAARQTQNLARRVAIDQRPFQIQMALRTAAHNLLANRNLVAPFYSTIVLERLKSK